MGRHEVEDSDLTRAIYELAQSVDKFTAAAEIMNTNVAVNNELLRAQADKEEEE